MSSISRYTQSVAPNVPRMEHPYQKQANGINHHFHSIPFHSTPLQPPEHGSPPTPSLPSPLSTLLSPRLSSSPPPSLPFPSLPLEALTFSTQIPRYSPSSPASIPHSPSPPSAPISCPLFYVLRLDVRIVLFVSPCPREMVAWG